MNGSWKAALVGFVVQDWLIAELADRAGEVFDLLIGVGAVLAARGDRRLFAKGYGLADREHAVPNTSRTAFRIGSQTKTFTAIALLRLQEQGSLRVADPIGRHLPGYPDGDAITLHHLLTNTSGIPDYVTTEGFTHIMGTPRMRASLIADFKDRPLLFEPGALHSTVEDLHRWNRGLPRLLRPASLAELVKPHAVADGIGYGYGCAVRGDRVESSGGTIGFVSVSAHYRRDDLFVTVLSNIENAAFTEIEAALAAIACGEPYELPSRRVFVTVDPAVLDRYAGRYTMRYMGRTSTMDVTRDGDRLMVEVHGLARTSSPAPPPDLLPQADDGHNGHRVPSGCDRAMLRRP